MAEASHAVFLSYASEDVEAARRICEALRGAGIEVWLDQSELRGGDTWDRKIHDQIRHCALFIPVISAHSQARLEGYFRREWKFAVERKRDIADELAFLLPVVIDDTPERGASVPEGFHEVQWTRLPGGAASQEFIAHVSRLLTGKHDGSKPAVANVQPSPARVPHQPPSVSKSGANSRKWLLPAGVAIATIAGYIGIDRYLLHKGTSPSTPPSVLANTTPASFSPPPHSLAVLPFLNMSGDKDQEYFSDGVTEEILNSLARINELQVAARTSAFSFKGKDVKIGAIARELNVGAILEGSVRRSGHTVRITAQLINAVTGFHLWSETYDRDLKDVLKLQTEIANAVASALKVTLLADAQTKTQVGGTQSPAAFDAYLRAWNAYWTGQGEEAYQAAIAAFSEAIRLDPGYALAYADRSFVLADFAQGSAKGPAIRDFFTRAQGDALKAIALEPALGEAHMALAFLLANSLDFPGASREYQRALELVPGNARLLAVYGGFASQMGQNEAGIAAAQRSVMLDPLNPWYRVFLGAVLANTRHYAEAIATYKDAMSRAPNDVALRSQASAWLGYPYYLSGDFVNARATCESAQEDIDDKSLCLAMTYEKLGRHADAKTILNQLLASSCRADHPVLCAMVYAQWGDSARGIDWLEKAMRSHDVYLLNMKFPAFDPLRKEPRFQAIERELKFPN